MIPTKQKKFPCLCLLQALKFCIEPDRYQNLPTLV